MIRKIALAFLCLFSLLCVCNVDAATITFQQGLNGYSGCQDTFVNTSAYGEDVGVNYGINTFLILNSEHFENF